MAKLNDDTHVLLDGAVNVYKRGNSKRWQASDTDFAKARCYAKALRRGLTFRSRARAGNGVPKYRI